MEACTGMDMHKRYSVCAPLDAGGRPSAPVRVPHDRETVRSYLRSRPPGSVVALETIGNWYWMVSEIESAGLVPKLAHAGKAKLMAGHINKTDKLDAEGLARLEYNGTLPTVWIPPAELRDQRELTRSRMSIVGMRTKLKNRIHATLDKYLIRIEEVTDIFGKRGRELLEARLAELPPETRQCVGQELELLDQVQRQIDASEARIDAMVKETPEMQRLRTLPGVGRILASVIWLELGTIDRFPRAEKLASYAGTTPRVHSSGGKTRYGHTRSDVNQYLRWAFVEAANGIVMNQRRAPESHAVQMYLRIRRRGGHGKAVVAVARHLAEATYWMLKKQEAYREPKGPQDVSSTQG